MMFCPCCERHHHRFLPFGVKPRPDARCPGCGALERHRLLWLFFQARTTLWQSRLRVLHVAPERALRVRLAALPNLRYVTADLVAGEVSVRCDLTQLPWPDDCFDVILCNHVLEHVTDDQRAMAELCRVLSPTGWAILQSPIDRSLNLTFEDPTVVDPAERQRLFGQADHVRRYGRDYRDRLERVGLRVRVDRFVDELGPVVVRSHGLQDEDIYLCTKADPRLAAVA